MTKWIFIIRLPVRRVNDPNPLSVYEQQIVNFDLVIISPIDHS
jgi:hypothetical protein